MPISKLFTYKEAAAILTVSQSFLRQKVMRNKIPYRKIGRSVRFTPEDIEAIIEAVPAKGGSK